MVSLTVQTELVRKFTGSTGLAIYPSATAVTDCVELDCRGLGSKLSWWDRKWLAEHEVEICPSAQGTVGIHYHALCATLVDPEPSYGEVVSAPQSSESESSWVYIQLA